MFTKYPMFLESMEYFGLPNLPPLPGRIDFDDRGLLKLNIGSGVRSERQNARLQYLFETGHFDEEGAVRTDLARLHRIRSGAPSLRDPYLPAGGVA